MTEQLSKSVCAVFVTYFPDVQFIGRLKQILPQVTTLLIIDNTPSKSRTFDVKGAIQELHQVLLIENRFNIGIAAALNQGLAYAAAEGYEWIVTLDQDTQANLEMVSTLLKLARACDVTPAVIGSNYFDPQANRTKVPNGNRGDDYLEQRTVITSGSLVHVHRALQIGGFRDDYFIDQVDHEFCLRARARGYAILISCQPLMTHSVGMPGGVRLPFLGTLPNHPPIRKYYIARNTIVTVVTHWRTEPAWSLRRLVRLFLGLIEMALLEQYRIRKVRAFAVGVIDGLQSRLGPCNRKWLMLDDPK